MKKAKINQAFKRNQIINLSHEINTINILQLWFLLSLFNIYDIYAFSACPNFKDHALKVKIVYRNLPDLQHIMHRV